MDKKGLTKKEAKKRLKKYGKNKIQRKNKVNPLKILLSQFTSPLIIILLIAVVVLGLTSFFTEESNLIDIILILIIVLVSGMSGFLQDYKAEKSIEELQKMAQPKARVIRGGKELEIRASKIVPGDVVLVSEGDVIPADAKIIESNAKVNESALTGESKSVSKNKNEWIYMNTSLVIGNAKALVKKTGMDTELGKIAGKLEEMEEEKTPFYKEVENLSKKISFIILGIVVIVVIAGLFKYDFYDTILSAIALAVAAIPEGLPAVIVLTLAIGAKAMMRKKALIRKLGVAESLGGVNVICADKTGTMTKNEMQVTKIYTDKEYDVENFKKENFKELLLCSVLNNNVRKLIGQDKLIGDQTEVALYSLGKKFNFKKEDLEYKRIKEVPFSSERKMMSVVVKGEDYKVYSKGAPEVLIKKCDRILKNGKIKKLTEKSKKEILNKNREFSFQELRVLGFAYKNLKEKNKNNENKIENNLIWIGLEGIMDPPRKGVKNAIKECNDAGIRVLMLTGDNPNTAKAIASEVNINTKEILIGDDVESLRNSELKKKLNQGVNVFARLNPHHKFRIMKLLQQKNVVAMTGDGVNDALALKKADVGVAMGIRGTDVSKQASDLILLDDNFVTIVTGIKEGRRIFDNARKFINYLLTSNMAEVFVIFLATLFLTLKYPILLPVQLLWINLLTDGFPALALGVDPARPDIMKNKPRKKTEHLVDKRLLFITFIIGIILTMVLFGIFFLTNYLFSQEIARTSIFTGFIVCEITRIGSIRYREKLKWTANKWLLIALLFTILLQFVVIYSPLNSLFKIVPLGIFPWTIIIIGALVSYGLAIFFTKIVLEHVKNV